MTKRKWNRLLLPAILLSLMICSTNCIKTVTRPVILASERLTIKCPCDTIGGKVYFCDSSMYGMSKSALVELYNLLRDCEMENEKLKNKK